VGTGSARAGVFDARGRLLGTSEAAIALLRPCPDHPQQSSADIWAAVCRAVRGAMSEAGAAPERVTGLGFNATCSLVVSDADERPLPDLPHAMRTMSSPAREIAPRGGDSPVAVYDSLPGAFGALLPGEVDVVVALRKAGAVFLQRARLDDRIRIAGAPLRSERHVVALARKRAELLPAVDDALAAM